MTVGEVLTLIMDFLKLLKQISAKLALALIIGSIVMLFLFLYHSESGIECGFHHDPFDCGFKSKISYEEKDMYGYFYTLDHEGKSVCMEERLNLRFYDDNTIQGAATGPVHKDDGTKEIKTWKLIGFRHGNDYALSYRTASPQSTGTGVFYLMSGTASPEGYWLGVDFPEGHRVQCLYVLSESRQDLSICERIGQDKKCKVLKRN